MNVRIRLSDDLGREEMIEAAEMRCEKVRDLKHRQSIAFDRYREAVDGMDGLRAIAYRERVGGGGDAHGDDALMRILEDTAERLDRYVQLLNEYAAELEEFDRVLSRMESQLYAKVLSLRYVSDLEWRDIAAELNYSANHLCTYVANAALLQFYDAMI